MTEDKCLFERIGATFIEALLDEKYDDQRVEFPNMRASGAYFIDYLCMELYAYTHVTAIAEEDVEEMLNQCAIDLGEDFETWPDLIAVLSFREMPVIYWYNMINEMRNSNMIESEVFCKTIISTANSIIYVSNNVPM
ncbi:MAG TPA: hypothetical protein PLQ04_04410 [Lachnospiraceae bacterium]|nr:hypothetical protein [Lachnospiraceae bacterium]